MTEQKGNSHTLLIVACCLFWACGSLVALGIGGFSTLSGEQVGWGILLWPFGLAYICLVAIPPPALVALSLSVKNNWVSFPSFIAAVAVQILVWPGITECYGATSVRCADAYATYRVIVWLGWPFAVLAFLIHVYKRMQQHFVSDPYIVALRERQGPEMEAEEFPAAAQTLSQEETVDKTDASGHAKSLGSQNGGRRKQYWELYEDD